MSNYPFFVPPDHLLERPAREWSLQEARDYKRWVLASMDERIEGLLEFLECSISRGKVKSLKTLGKKLAERLKSDEFSKQSGATRVLKNEGFAIAADAGLLVAKLLMEEFPDELKWKLVRRPKSDMSYNLPVIIGFPHNVYLEPVGGSIAEARSVIEGLRDSDIWANIYTNWRRKI